ncbi:MAG: alpha/beta hydrolase [Prolixibacteraceae bacterium]
MKLPFTHITGSGQPFIWLHGLLNSIEADSLYSLIDFNKLSELVSLVRYDYRNKAADGDYTWPALCDELTEVAGSLNQEKLLLGGLSMGAATILHFATRFPERVKAMILVTPPPGWEMRTETKKVYRKIVARTNNQNIPEILKRIIQWSQDPPDFFEQKHPGTRQKLQELRLNFEPQYYSQIYSDGANSDFPSREQISQINVPTLIVSIPNDVTHPVEMAQLLHNLIKTSEMIVISGYNDFENLQKKISDFVLEVENNYKS